MNYYLLGLGVIGESFLRIFRESGLFDPESFYVIDCDSSKKERFVNLGGSADHFFACMVNGENCTELLAKLNPGDTLIDLAENIRNIKLLNYCLAHGVHYLSTADASFNEEDRSVFSNFREFQQAKKKFPPDAATSIIEYGMNPGLVSAFVKAAIDDIIGQDSSPYVKEHRGRLEELTEGGRYAEAAALLKITGIAEVDHDDQKPIIPFEEDVFYTTWNAYACFEECSFHPQIAFGSAEDLHACPRVFRAGEEGCFAMIEGKASDCRVRIWSPQGIMEGNLTVHEEIYPIRDFLRFREYAPTVYFVYCPCEYARRSHALFPNELPKKIHLLRKEEIVSGGESVGMILYGEHFHPRYFGCYLLTENAKETATAVQVSASLFAAVQYMQNHPDSGLLFPEDLDHREVLKSASRYLGTYISKEIQPLDGWTPDRLPQFRIQK